MSTNKLKTVKEFFAECIKNLEPIKFTTPLLVKLRSEEIAQVHKIDVHIVGNYISVDVVGRYLGVNETLVWWLDGSDRDHYDEFYPKSPFDILEVYDPNPPCSNVPTKVFTGLSNSFYVPNIHYGNLPTKIITGLSSALYKLVDILTEDLSQKERQDRLIEVFNIVQRLQTPFETLVAKTEPNASYNDDDRWFKDLDALKKAIGEQS